MSRWGYNRVSEHTKYYAGVQNACLQVMGKQGAFQNILKSSKILLKNIFELTHKIKTAQKVVLNFFQINLKIN